MLELRPEQLQALKDIDDPKRSTGRKMVDAAITLLRNMPGTNVAMGVGEGVAGLAGKQLSTPDISFTDISPTAIVTNPWHTGAKAVKAAFPRVYDRLAASPARVSFETQPSTSRTLGKVSQIPTGAGASSPYDYEISAKNQITKDVADPKQLLRLIGMLVADKSRPPKMVEVQPGKMVEAWPPLVHAMQNEIRDRLQGLGTMAHEAIGHALPGMKTGTSFLGGDSKSLQRLGAEGLTRPSRLSPKLAPKDQAYKTQKGDVLDKFGNQPEYKARDSVYGEILAENAGIEATRRSPHLRELLNAAEAAGLLTGNLAPLKPPVRRQ